MFEQYTYEYDRNSNITKETLKSEKEEVREHTYTAQGQLAGTQVTIDGVSRQPYRYTYDIVGNRTSVQHGSVTAFEYNGLNQMIRKTDHGNGSMVTDYTYDGSGN